MVRKKCCTVDSQSVTHRTTAFNNNFNPDPLALCGEYYHQFINYYYLQQKHYYSEDFVT